MTRTLVGNTAQTTTYSGSIGGAGTTDWQHSQPFSTDAGAFLASVSLIFDTTNDQTDVGVAIYTNGTNNRPDELLYSLAHPGTVTNGTNVFTAPDGSIL